MRLIDVPGTAMSWSLTPLALLLLWLLPQLTLPYCRCSHDELPQSSAASVPSHTRRDSYSIMDHCPVTRSEARDSEPSRGLLSPTASATAGASQPERPRDS